VGVSSVDEVAGEVHSALADEEVALAALATARWGRPEHDAATERVERARATSRTALERYFLVDQYERERAARADRGEAIAPEDTRAAQQRLGRGDP